VIEHERDDVTCYSSCRVDLVGVVLQCSADQAIDTSRMQKSFWSNWFKPTTASSRKWTLEELGELYDVLLRNGECVMPCLL
jgi:phage baseplate assembly protein gpV